MLSTNEKNELIKDAKTRLKRAQEDKDRHKCRLDDYYELAMPWRHQIDNEYSDDNVDNIFDSTAMDSVSDFASDMLATFTPDHFEWIEPTPNEQFSEKDAGLSLYDKNPTGQGRPDHLRNESDQYDRIIKFKPAMQKNWEEALQKRILEFFDRSYQDKKHSVKLALEELQEAIKLCEMMTMSFPEHQEAKSQLKELKQAYADIGGVQVEEKFASEYNKSHKGQILFSKSKIIIGQENDSQFVQEVKLSEPTDYQLVAYADKAIKYAAFMMPDDYRPAAIGFVMETSTDRSEVCTFR